MKDENTEKEIERRVKKELATRDFLSDIRKASIDAMCGEALTATDLIPILTDFTVQGYITAHGYDKKGKAFFKNAVENSWDDCLEDYKKAREGMDIDENDTDDSLLAKKALMKILSDLASR
jgi:hypothetical protein